MKAAIVESSASGFTLADIDLAEPEGAVSRQDLGIPLPSVFGHEVAGVVATIGPNVRGLGVGDRVVACLIQYCGTCP